MSTSSQPSIIHSMKSFSRAASLITMLVGSLVLLGWLLNVPVLKSILPGLATMKANSALGFIVTGLALFLFSRGNTTPLTRYMIQSCALVIALLGLVTLCEYIFNLQLGIDQWLFQDTTRGGDNLTPGRMSPTTALNFLFLGTALLFLDRGTSLGSRLAHFLALVVALFSGLALLGYIYGASALYGIGAYNQIALHTAFTFIIAATGLLCVYPDRGLMATITSENAGGFMVRRLLPSAIILPVILGWLRLEGQRAGLYDTELGLALIVSSSIVVFVVIIWRNARLLNKTDADLKLEQATDLRQNEERLRYVTWAIRDAVWDRNIASGEISWNEGLQKLLHYHADEIEPNISWWEQHIHPEDREKVVRSIQQILDTKQSLWSKEYRFQRRDESYANVFDRGYILYDEQTGEPTRMIGAMADITEQKQTEQALRQSEALFAKIFSTSPVSISLTRVSDGHFIEVNDGYLKLVEYSRSEVLGKTTLELGVISTEVRARLLQIMTEQGAVRDFEYWLSTKSGGLKAVLCSLEQVEVEGEACLLSIVYDITERKQAEAAQQESEALFRALFELSPDSVVIIDPHDPNVSWPIIDCNAAACLMNGYQREELLGQSIDILNGTTGTPAERKAYLKLLHKDGSIKGEFQHRHKNGAVFPIETSTTLITTGARELLIGIDRDITVRKQAEQELRESEEKYRSMIDNVKDYAIFMLDAQGNVKTWNAGAERLKGYSANEIIGQSFSRFYPEEDLANGKPENELVTAVADGRVEDEGWRVRKDGSRFWATVTITALHDEKGQLRGFSKVTRDITAHKQAEQALAQEQYLLNTLLENAPDHIYFKDSESRFMRISSAHARLFGLSDPAQAIGKTDFDFSAEEHARHAYEGEQEIIRSGQPLTQEERQVWTDRPDSWVIETKMPLRNQNGEIIGTFGISKDITRRKQAEEALHATNENLTRGLAELDQRNREILLLNELGNLLQTCETPDEAYTIIENTVPKIFPDTPGALYVISPSRDVVEAVAAWQPLTPEEQAFAPKDCLALRRGQVQFVTVEAAGLQCEHVTGAPASSICVPMMAQGEALGVFHLQRAHDAARGDLKPVEQGLAKTIADTIALALTNLRLRETLRNQSIRDPLTGLFNRRFMEESLERELQRAARNKRPLGIIMLDLDHFKDFNDTFGHAAGDALLREMAIFLRQRIRGSSSSREGDIACRYGGEEFLLIMPEASLEITRQRAQKLCDEINQLQVQHRGQMLGSVTLSLGVAVSPEHGLSADDLVRAADAALYRAKHKGRNQVVVARRTKKQTES